MQQFIRITLLAFITLLFTTCKKDKTFGDKYPELLGEWEWVKGYYTYECSGPKYGAGPGGGKSTCYSYFYPGENYYKITNHRLLIKHSGVFIIGNKGRLLEKGRFEIGLMPQVYFDKKNNIIEKQYYLEEKRNIFSNFFIYNRESVLGIDYLERNLSIKHKYYIDQNTEEIIIRCEKAGRATPDSTFLNLIYYKK